MCIYSRTVISFATETYTELEGNCQGTLEITEDGSIDSFRYWKLEFDCGLGAVYVIDDVTGNFPVYNQYDTFTSFSIENSSGEVVKLFSPLEFLRCKVTYTVDDLPAGVYNIYKKYWFGSYEPTDTIEPEVTLVKTIQVKDTTEPQIGISIDKEKGIVEFIVKDSESGVKSLTINNTDF